MAILVSTNICWLIVGMVSILQLASGNFKETLPSSENLPSISEPPPVTVSVISNIRKPGVVFFNLESESVVKVKYSVNCSSYETVYSVVATTSTKQVAFITSSAIFNISCATVNNVNGSLDRRELSGDSKRDHLEKDIPQTDVPTFLRFLEGEVNMTIYANNIGRTFLLFLVHEISGVDRMKSNLDHSSNVHSDPFPPDSNISLSKTKIIPGSVSNIHNMNKLDVFQVSDQNAMPPNVAGRTMIIVMQMPRTSDEIFRIVLYVVIILATAGMGVKVDFMVIKNTLRRPTGPIIGICCQYICMPLIAYFVARVVPQESPAVSLGIFACGIVPGGGPSNMFSYLLGGDLSLSVTMTTLSSIAALGLLPLWLFTLGDTFKDDTVTMHVPYEKILEALAVAILPLFIGMFIKYKVPRAATIISKILKPVLIIIVSFTISFGVYTNFYIFKMIRPMTIVAGCLLPYVGYIIGGFISFLCCRSWTHIKTIAIETGIQNTAVAFLILFLSLPPPDNQLASVAPAASAVMTPLPLFVAVFAYTIYQRCTRKHQAREAKAQNITLENGNIQNEKSQIGVDDSIQEEETALIILLWRKLTGSQKNINQPNKTAFIKELDAMLPEKAKLANS